MIKKEKGDNTMNTKNEKAVINDAELKNVGGGLIHPFPPSAETESPFHTTFDGNSKTVNLNISPNKRITEIDAPGIDIYSTPEP